MRTKTIMLAAVLAAASVGSAAQAAPLQPLKDSVRGVPLAQFLGTAELLGEWRAFKGGGNARLVNVMTRAALGECEADDVEDSDSCARYTLFLVLNGRTFGPVDFAVYQLPETLGWALPESFQPDESGQTAVVPLDACEMKKTAKGYGWKGVSYRLTMGERLVGGKVGPNFLYTVSLDKLPGERPNCAAR